MQNILRNAPLLQSILAKADDEGGWGPVPVLQNLASHQRPGPLLVRGARSGHQRRAATTTRPKQPGLTAFSVPLLPKPHDQLGQRDRIDPGRRAIQRVGLERLLDLRWEVRITDGAREPARYAPRDESIWVFSHGITFQGGGACL
jgi:hypothetical protein